MKHLWTDGECIVISEDEEEANLIWSEWKNEDHNPDFNWKILPDEEIVFIGILQEEVTDMPLPPNAKMTVSYDDFYHIKITAKACDWATLESQVLSSSEWE